MLNSDFQMKFLLKDIFEGLLKVEFKHCIAQVHTCPCLNFLFPSQNRGTTSFCEYLYTVISCTVNKSRCIVLILWHRLHQLPLKHANKGLIQDFPQEKLCSLEGAPTLHSFSVSEKPSEIKLNSVLVAPLLVKLHFHAVFRKKYCK